MKYVSKKKMMLDLIADQDQLIKELNSEREKLDEALTYACLLVEAQYNSVGIYETKEEIKKAFLERASR